MKVYITSWCYHSADDSTCDDFGVCMELFADETAARAYIRKVAEEEGRNWIADGCEHTTVTVNEFGDYYQVDDGCGTVCEYRLYLRELA